jgi:hypothetical protein
MRLPYQDRPAACIDRNFFVDERPRRPGSEAAARVAMKPNAPAVLLHGAGGVVVKGPVSSGGFSIEIASSGGYVGVAAPLTAVSESKHGGTTSRPAAAVKSASSRRTGTC